MLHRERSAQRRAFPHHRLREPVQPRVHRRLLEVPIRVPDHQPPALAHPHPIPRVDPLHRNLRAALQEDVLAAENRLAAVPSHEHVLSLSHNKESRVRLEAVLPPVRSVGANNASELYADHQTLRSVQPARYLDPAFPVCHSGVGRKLPRPADVPVVRSGFPTDDPMVRRDNHPSAANDGKRHESPLARRVDEPLRLLEKRRLEKRVPL